MKIKQIQNFAFENNLWTKGSRIIVAVSGGPDSVCLLDILFVLSKKYDFSLHIAHVNYGLRGEESEKDEKLVRQLAKKYDLPISVFQAKNKSIKGNLENNLRNIRYAFFEELRKECVFDLVAVAHNQDDQAETVLMRVIRGAGLNGLGSIRPKNGKIIRPLLLTSRAQILSYIKEKKLRFRIDKSNKDLKFTRNVVRNKLLPYLEKNFNPSIKKNLSIWTQHVAADYDFINKEAERFVFGVCKNKRAHFCVRDYLGIHEAIGRQAIRIIFYQLMDKNLDIETRQILEIVKIIKSSKNKTQKAFIGGLNVIKKGDKIEIFC